ncbi:hypothetical protein [Pseudomonas sp.]|uniref:hypothetical protein n=1 Tax=Pseudomonas sp. TaxID=306 RepID=UPI003D1171B7
MPRKKPETTDNEFVLLVPGGEVRGRQQARDWLVNEREAALARARQPGTDVLGCLARALTCNRALGLLEAREKLDFTRMKPATTDDALEVFRQA